MAAIDLEGVTKEFGDVRALRGVDLTVEDGEIFGFLGPNGAGKSTTINIMLDFITPTSGHVEVLGLDAQRESKAVRQRTGVLPEGYDVYDRLTGRKHVEFALRSKGLEGDPDRVLERVSMAGAADRKAGDYSKGMQQRLILAMALVGEPDLLILDEPTTGLDPNGAREVREIVRQERDRGATVFFSSHILGQVEAVCDRVGILRDGDLVATDTIEGLREAVGGSDRLHVTLRGQPSEPAVDAVRDLRGVSSLRVNRNTLSIDCDDGAKTAVITALEDEGAVVEDFSTEEASLEELFRTYTTEEVGA